MNRKESTLTKDALDAMKKAVRGVVEDHHRRNRPLPVWKNNQVVYVDVGALPVVRESRAPYEADSQEGAHDAS